MLFLHSLRTKYYISSFLFSFHQLNVQLFTRLKIYILQPKLLHPENESRRPPVTMTSSLSLRGCQFSENNRRSKHVTKVFGYIHIKWIQ